MPRPLAYTPEVGAVIRGARLVGTPLRTCAKAAGVPYATLCDWLAKGRAYNDAAVPDRDAKHAVLGAFAADMDRAAGQSDAVLHQRVMKGTEKDGRLAFDVIRWKSEAATRAAKRELIEAQRDVERNRAAGTHVERHEVRDVSGLTDDELRAEAQRLAATDLDDTVH